MSHETQVESSVLPMVTHMLDRAEKLSAEASIQNAMNKCGNSFFSAPLRQAWQVWKQVTMVMLEATSSLSRAPSLAYPASLALS